MMNCQTVLCISLNHLISRCCYIYSNSRGYEKSTSYLASSKGLCIKEPHLVCDRLTNLQTVCGGARSALANLAERFLQWLWTLKIFKYIHNHLLSRKSEFNTPFEVLANTIAFSGLRQTDSEMEYLIRFVHQHEPFRKPEIDALAELCKINIRWISYSDAVRRFSL